MFLDKWRGGLWVCMYCILIAASMAILYHCFRMTVYDGLSGHSIILVSMWAIASIKFIMWRWV